MSAFGNFLRKIGKVFKPAEGVREWRQQKRQYRAFLQELGQDAEAVRSGVREWVKNNPKPKKTKEERDKTLSEIPQLFEEGRELFTGNGGATGVESTTFAGVTPQPVRTGGLNPFLLLLLVPLVFPKQFKKFFNF